MYIKARPVNPYNNKQVSKGALHTKFCPFLHDTGIKVLDDKNYLLSAQASTTSIDRDGEIVLPSAFMMDNFWKNPQFLWNHRWWGDIEDNLGFVQEAKADENALVATFFYDVDNCERARKCWNKVLSKSIRGYSVGFRMVEWVTPRDDEEIINALPAYAAQALRRGDVWLVHTKVELIEISQVLIPSNVDSVAEVDGVMTLGSAPDQSKAEQERTDQMSVDLTKFQSQLDEMTKSISSLSEKQDKQGSAMVHVAESVKSVAEMVTEMKKQEAEAQAKAAESPSAPPAPDYSQIKSLGDLPDDVQDKIVGEVMEALEIE